MDRSVIPDPKLVTKLMQLAEKHNIPVQYRRNTAGGTDAGKIQATAWYFWVAVFAVPTRYIHSPVSVISKGLSKCIEVNQGISEKYRRRRGLNR